MTTLTTEQQEVVAKTTAKLITLGMEIKFLPNEISVGPIVSVYRFMPVGRTKVSHLEALADDLAVTLGVEDVFVKRMPGESAVGVFVPNRERKWVDFKDTISSVWARAGKFADGVSTIKVPLNFGVDYLGAPFVEDLSGLPHLLIAGSTGSGKSTLLASMISSIIYVVNSSDIRLVLSDTKGVEFGRFIGAPHLLFEPATNVYRTLEQLDWAIDETANRLLAFGKGNMRNVHEYNATKKERLPFIIIVIDELADLLTDKRKAEDRGPSIAKLAESKIATIAQRARAAGVYMVAATQRPSVDILRGSIKANFPARLTFRLPSEADSRTVIGTSGAEHLLSRGDCLYVSPDRPGLSRLHAPFAKIEDINAAVEAAIRREEAR